MAINVSTQGVEIARYVGAVYGLVLDDATVVSIENVMNAVGGTPTADVDAVVNSAYAADFSTATNASVATTVATNLGLTGTLLSQAQAYILAQLNAASAGTQGQTIMNILNMFGQLTSDPVWGAAATAWETKVSAAVTYGQNANNTSNSQMSAMSSVAPGITYTLTTGVDTATANTFYGTLDNNYNTALATATLGGADTLTGAAGTNNKLVLTDSSATGQDTIPVGATITNIQSITLNTAGNAGIGTGTGSTALDVSGIAGVTSLTVTSAGHLGDNINAAATTNVTDVSKGVNNLVEVNGGNNITVTNSGDVYIGDYNGFITTGTVAAGAITVNNSSGGFVVVDGGTAVTVNETGTASIYVDSYSAAAGISTGPILINDTGSTGGAVLEVGSTGEVPTGAITINYATVLAAPGSGDAIITNGGSTVTINEKLAVSSTEAAAIAAATASGAVTILGGAVQVTAGTATTSVSVTQTASSVANPGTVAGTPGTATPAVAAQPGYQGAAAVAGSAATALVPGTLGVVDSTVTITDNNAVLTSVSLTNSGTFSSATGNAISTVTLGGSSGDFLLTEASAKNSAITLNLNSVTPGYDASGNPLINSFTILDSSSKITTLNANVNGNSSFSSLIDESTATATPGALNTLNVSGSGVLTVGGTLPTTITALNVTGAAGFNGSIVGTGITAFAPTSTGQITTTLTATTQSFTGGAGQDIVTIGADATKAITGGTANNNEIILGTAGTYTAANTGTNVTHFSTLGVAATVQMGATAGTVDMSQLTGTYNALDVIGNATTENFTNVATGASLAIDGSAGMVGYQTVNATGTSDTVTVTFGKAANATDLTATALTLNDANGVGIGTVNLVSNDNGGLTGVNTITTLTDSGVSVLNVTGTGGLSIGTLNENPSGSHTAAISLTINNNETNAAGVTIASISDANLGSLTFTGSNATTINYMDPTAVTTMSVSDTGSQAATITGLTDNSLTSLTMSGSSAVNIGTLIDSATGITVNNTGTAADTITAINSSTLTSLTLTGAVGLGVDTLTAGVPNQATAIGATTGVTVSAGTDNAHINLNLRGTASSASTAADTITVGNGNDYITDGSTVGTVNVTVGTGSNLIVLGGTTTDTTGMYNVTLGAHTATSGIDVISIGNVTYSVPATGSSVAYPSAPNLVVTGAVAGDQITLAGELSSTQTITVASTATTAGSTVAATVSALETAAAAALHTIQYSVFGGNTYVVDANAGNLTQTTSAQTASNYTVIELVGTHTFTGGAGHIVVA